MIESFYKYIDNLKNSDTVFIIGGGPSLPKTIPDPNILKDKDVFCCNDGFKVFPYSLVTLFADHEWYDWNEKYLYDYMGMLVTSFHFLEDYNQKFLEKRIPVFKDQSSVFGLSVNKNTLNGKNCGHQCINLAVHCGYKNIILCGFDMDSTKDSNWHDFHQRAENKEIYNVSMLPGMDSIVPYQEKLGFKIYNANPDSKIKCFEFKDLKEFL